MSYSRHNWQCGELISDTKLNNIEDGIEEALACCGSSDILLVTGVWDYEAEYPTCVLDKTWQQIRDAFPNCMLTYGQPAQGDDWGLYMPINIEISNYDTPYQVYAIIFGSDDVFNPMGFTCQTANDYPVHTMGG